MIRSNPMRALGLFGGLLVVVSILFEYVRMAPDYRLIVEPWSIRGYDLTQGRVIAAVGVGIMVLVILAGSKQGSMVFNAITGFGLWLAAILIAQFPDPPPVDISIPAFIGIVVTSVFAYIIARTLMNVFGDRVPDRSRRYVTLGTFIGLFLVFFLAFVSPTFVTPERTEVDISVIVAITLGIVVIAAVLARPRELAVARMTIIASLVSWVVIATVGGGTRTRLIQAQLEVMGVSGTYRDTQITSGLMVAFAGIIIVFLASVGLWARKRDRLQVLARARKQQEAAAQSAAELAEVQAAAAAN